MSAGNAYVTSYVVAKMAPKPCEDLVICVYGPFDRATADDIADTRNFLVHGDEHYYQVAPILPTTPKEP